MEGQLRKPTEEELEMAREVLKNEGQDSPTFKALFQLYEKNSMEALLDEFLGVRKIRLSDMEAGLIDKYVAVDGQIVGEMEQKAIIQGFELECADCGSKKTVPVDLRISLFGKPIPPKECDCGGRVEAKPLFGDYALIFLKDVINRDSNHSVKKFKDKTIYLVGMRPPASKTVKVVGRIGIEPKSKDLVIMANRIEPLATDFEQFRIQDKHRKEFPKYFGEGKEPWKQINPDIVGTPRIIAKQALSLQLHSVCRIWDIEHTKIIRGGLNIIFIGDSKVGKSDIAKDATNFGAMPLGELVIAETASRTGILYTIDSDRHAIIWGALPLNDRGLVVLDGMQAMQSEEMGEMRESIELQTVKVARSLSGEALARTRIIGCMNPRQTSMSNYLYKCQSISDSWVFCKTPDITRWDVFIPFCQKDVPAKTIAFRKSENRPIPMDIYIDHIYWAWSRRPEDVDYTNSAVYRIKQLTAELIDEYGLENLPIVHNGVRDIITRMAVSKAAELHSTDETHEKIIVETSHVDSVVAWYKEVLAMLELERYKADVEGRTEIDDSECIRIAMELGQTEYTILEAIKHQPQSSTQLANVLELSTRRIKDHYKPLMDNGLIDSDPGVGIKLTVKGIKFARWAMLNPGEIGTENVTIEGVGDVKRHHFTGQKWIGPLEKYHVVDKIQSLKAQGIKTISRGNPQGLLESEIEYLASKGLLNSISPNEWEIL